MRTNSARNEVSEAVSRCVIIRRDLLIHQHVLAEIILLLCVYCVLNSLLLSIVSIVVT